MSAETRLATYGTLAPGRVNHHQISKLNGFWRKGIVKGRLLEEGWGAQHDCPGIILDPAGGPVDVYIFESSDLARHWDRLDAFEGDEYRRTITKAECKDTTLEVSIYELNL